MAGSPADPIHVKVHARVLHRIDARLFGQFMEKASWGGEIGSETAVIPGTHELRPQAKELIRQMQIPVVRFPGGTDADYIDWLDMIDQAPGRSGDRPLTRGHTGNQVTNYFGYDEFLRLCEELKMEPIVVVNFRDGLLAKDGVGRAARHAAKLAAYCNARVEAELPEDLASWPRLRAANGHPQPYGVKYFQIGNESWAFADKAREEQYLVALEAYVDAIRRLDSTARVIVDGQPPELARRVHRRLGDRISYFAVHHYQPWQIKEVRRGDTLVDAAQLTAADIWYAWVTLPQVGPDGQSCFQRSELNQARDLQYKVAMTEWNWNGWWGASLRNHVVLDSLFARGLGAAGILHAIMRQGDVVELATQSMLIGDGWKIHAVWCDRNGKTPPVMLPSGQVTMLYSRHHGSQRLQIDIANVPCYEQPYRMGGIGPAPRAAYLDVLATRDKNTLYVHAINRHFDEALAMQVDLSALGRSTGAKGTLHVLEGRLSNAPAGSETLAPAQIREEKIDMASDKVTVRLPRRSVSVAEIPFAPAGPKS
jgi:alpha-N-arabinofuranosidase